jgi:outer membrane protein OmpA-like peptidoglycan-associated protein
MTRQLASLILCGAFVALAAACATKSFVEEQVSATETKLTQRVDTQETKLRETSDRAGASRQALDAADQKLHRLDTRVSEVDSLASGAKTRADLAAVASRDAEARLAQRIADRNKYRLLETRFIYFDSDKANIRDDGMKELDEASKTLGADANAILELQGFSDPRGTDRYNNQLARERIDGVIRYLVERHGIELRQIRAVAMGKVALAAGEKPTPEFFARARRVDMRLLAPWSSWEDAQAPIDPTARAESATVAVPAPVESGHPARAATGVRPVRPEPPQPRVDPPAEAAAALPRSVMSDDPATPERISHRPGRDGELKGDLAVRQLPVVLRSISPQDLGGTD